MGTLTTNDLQTQLAYRLGETSAPSDATQKAIRLDWFNEGYLDIARRRNWWWLQGTHSTNTNTASTTGYPEPSDLKEFIELKVGTAYYDQIPYVQNRQSATSIVSLPNSTAFSYQFYRFGGRYYFVLTDAGDATAHLIKYFKRASKVADGGTFLMPDEYMGALTAYGEARYWMSIGQQAKAVVPMQEFEEFIKQMNLEQGRLGSGWKQMVEIREPEDANY